MFFSQYIAKNRYNAGISGFIPLGENRIDAEAVYRYTGDGYFFDYATSPFDAFGTTDARVSFEYHENRISLFVKNIFDETNKLWHYAWQPGQNDDGIFRQQILIRKGVLVINLMFIAAAVTAMSFVCSGNVYWLWTL